MSRQSKFTLKFKGGLAIKINIAKSSDPKTSLRQTFPDESGENRSVRTVKVLAIDDVKPQSLEDIEKVIPWNAVQTSYPYRDEEDGHERLLHLDDKVRCKIFTKSEFMNFIGFLDNGEITPNMYAGDHYFLKIQVDTKSKKACKVDEQGYSLLYYILAEHDKAGMVKFISGDREKFGVIYRVGDGLMLSLLIHNNFQRAAPEVERIPLLKATALADKMLSNFSLRGFDPEMTNDRYEAMLKTYIDELTHIAAGGKIKPRLKIKTPVSFEDDFFSQLESL